MIKVIKTPEEYAANLARLHSLLDRDPERDSQLAEEIELLALLLSTYEAVNFDNLSAPSPIEAIRFRMEQLDLAQKDLIKYIGSASRVSEVLSGKRPLTLPMIRSLHEGLGIPADVLIGEQYSDVEVATDTFDITKLPRKEMVRRRWLELPSDHNLRAFIAPVLPYAAAFKRTVHFRGTRNIDTHALVAWLARVWHRAQVEASELPPYEPANLTVDLLSELVRLSSLERGPVIALEFLEHVGVAVVVEPALPRTFVDGVTLFGVQRPIIGLTLRFDRLDNFWYVLLHELSHILLHSLTASLFLDDLESGVVADLERQADDLATQIAIPEEVWKSSPASKIRTRQAAEHLARQLRISTAIVAGRIRRHYDDYRVLGDLVGQGEVRKLFSGLDWSN